MKGKEQAGISFAGFYRATGLHQRAIE